MAPLKQVQIWSCHFSAHNSPVDSYLPSCLTWPTWPAGSGPSPLWPQLHFLPMLTWVQLSCPFLLSPLPGKCFLQVNMGLTLPSLAGSPSPQTALSSSPPHLPLTLALLILLAPFILLLLMLPSDMFYIQRVLWLLSLQSPPKYIINSILRK